MTTDSAELRDVYEAQYDGRGEEARRAGAWRALSARGKAGHIEELTRREGLSPRAVVEIGCGDGVLLAELARRGVGERFHGFDISARAAGYAAARPEVERAERFDGRSIPGEDAAYDLAVLSHVLEHVPEPAPLLMEAARVARAVVMEVPLEDNRSAGRSTAQEGRDAVGHLHRFSRARVHALAAEAGLRVVAELADPLPRAVHTFWGSTAAGTAKWAVRKAVFTVAPRTAERAFTLHHAALLLPS